MPTKRHRGKSSSRPPFLKHVGLDPGEPIDFDQFPFSLPFVKDLDLSFERSITYFVGENGSGKSTLIEAIAELAGLPVSGGGRNEAAAGHGPEREGALASALRPAFATRPRDGYFLR